MGFISANVGRLMGSTSTALAGAQALLAGETQGLAFDFTDQSAYIIDTGTPANNYNSTGIVSSGSLVGPSGKLTYTSPSSKLTLQSDGYIKYQAHNLYLNSAAPANQSITVVSGASYAVTITGTVSVTASGAATGTWTAGTNTFTAATTTLTLGSTSGSGTVHVRRTPSNDDYIETAGAAKYALPLEYDTSGNCEGLLVEEARTNLCLYSGQFDNAAWTPTASSVTPNNATGPDGLTSADLLYESTANTVHYISPTANITVVSGTVYTVSVYAKQSTRYRIRVGYFDATFSNGVRIDADLSAGTVGSAAADGTGSVTSSGIEDAGNGFYKIWVSGSQSTSTNGRVFISLLNDSGTLSYLGDGASGVHLWGAQLEAGSFPTSPIVTYGAASSRLVDNISIASTAFPWSGSTDSVYAHFTGASGANTTAGQFVFVMDGTQDIDLLSPSSASQLNAGASVGGSCVLATSYTGAGLTGKVAIANAASDLAASYDGGTVVTDTSNGVPGASGTFYVGSRNGTAPYNGIIKAISYVPRRKTDAELQAETA